MAKLLESESVEILHEYPGITRETVDGVEVGRIILPERQTGTWAPDSTFLRFYNALNGKSECAALSRRILVSNLNSNSPTQSESIAHGRALSAYFTYNPNGEAVIVEWGTIDMDGNAKLHTYLNRVIDYQVRAAQGMQLSSGHLAKVRGEETYLALLDRLSLRNDFAQNQAMTRMINTLHAYHFIPITAEGFVQAPFF